MKIRLLALIAKEWAELAQRKMLMLSIAAVPFLFLAISLAIAVGIPVLEGGKGFGDPSTKAAIDRLVAEMPNLGEATLTARLQILLVRQFALFFLMIPILTSVAIAAYSIVGEKTTRSLEPLLATPLTTLELLLGKCIAALLPSLAVTWLTEGLFVGAVAVLAEPDVLPAILDLSLLIIVFAVSPLLALLGVGLSVIASSKAGDPRSAQQVAALVVVPVIGLFLSQIQGLFLLRPIHLVGGALALAAVCAFLLRIGVRLFNRETILTRWK